MGLTRFLCYLPKWMGGGHRFGKPKETDIPGPEVGTKTWLKVCRRCKAWREVKRRMRK